MRPSNDADASVEVPSDHARSITGASCDQPLGPRRKFLSWLSTWLSVQIPITPCSVPVNTVFASRVHAMERIADLCPSPCWRTGFVEDCRSMMYSFPFCPPQASKRLEEDQQILCNGPCVTSIRRVSSFASRGTALMVSTPWSVAQATDPPSGLQ